MLLGWDFPLRLCNGSPQCTKEEADEQAIPSRPNVAGSRLQPVLVLVKSFPIGYIAASMTKDFKKSLVPELSIHLVLQRLCFPWLPKFTHLVNSVLYACRDSNAVLCVTEVVFLFFREFRVCSG